MFPIVFDTTLTNSGEYEGVCAHLSSWIGEEGKGDLLWCACRKHISELRMKWFCSKFLGDKKEPGVKLFRRFQTDFLEIEKIFKEEDLVRLDLSLVPDWVKELIKETLGWAENSMQTKIFPRDDYKEMLDWIIYHLGGNN